MKRNFSEFDIQNMNSSNFNNTAPQNSLDLNYEYNNNAIPNNNKISLTETNNQMNIINQNSNANTNTNLESINNINNINFNILQKQNQNLQQQIKVLTKRIKEYENDYIKDNDRKANQLKEFSELETNLNNQINNKDKIINSIKEENNYLKNYLNQMDKDIYLIKEEVKNLLLIKSEREQDANKQSLNNTISENNDINNHLIDLVKKYSNEIIYLKSQNEKLINNLNLMSNNIKSNNNNLSKDEIEKIKMIFKKEEKSNFDKFVSNFAKEINEELFVISQWIETYLGSEYDKGYEIPSLINHLEKTPNSGEKINLINFNIIKEALEKSTIKLNSIINNKETEIIKLSNIIKEKDHQCNELKKQIIQIRQKHIELNNEKDQLLLEQEQERKKILMNKNLINNLKENEASSKNNNVQYLKNLYEIIQKEINSILSDINFRPYHDNLLSIRENINIVNNKNNINNNLLEEKLNTSLIKIIEFIEELKYDYIQIKTDNIKFMKEKTNVKNILMKGNNIQNNNMALLEEYKYKIEELSNNNKLLREEMKRINDNNETKILIENEILENYENISKENQNLKFNNDSLINKLKMVNENYNVLENENNQLKRRIQKIKNMENDDNDLKQKINDLSIDYQRLLKENNSLKLYLNSQNFLN